MSLNVRRKSNLNILIMKKQILNLGKALKKAEQAQINGGRMQCDVNRDRVCEDFGWKCAETYCRILMPL
ncbi:hypothetical protein KUL156_51740 [Alteromonas sp. KUL156]|nr:hypothetical protein BACY1_19580 [Tenacibaculum mesophilum]GFD73649.1 hypothetical protein KUL113_30690 [Tenacibaculum sp. KUL113]GFD95361.1 hypothetical protein KUL154_40940 [Alteromonas sp. KUL154]GFE02582.1 hypothetical protein KUL156_51740 [Alteromonas sp. KUL156]